MFPPHPWVLLTLLFLPLACDEGTAPEPVPSDLELLAGDAQSARVETELPEELRLRVTDGRGDPVRGVAVVWEVTAGGGSLEAESTLTNGAGAATNQWTLGPEVGEQAVAVAVGGELDGWSSRPPPSRRR